MKAIYINQNHGPEKKKHRWLFLFFVFLLILGGVARIAAPYLITEYINKIGSDESGLRFKVNDVSLNVLHSKIKIGNLRVFNPDGSIVLLEFSNGLINVDPIRFLKKENLASQHWRTGEIILSKYLLEEMNSLKNKKKGERDIYFDSFKTTFDEFSIRQVSEENVKTILSLKEANIKLHNIGLGDSKKPTTFQFDSKIKEGGNLNITGKTLLDQPATPWDISGRMVKINADVLEKLAGKALPIDIREADINADIKASSKGGAVIGILTPDIKEFDLKDDTGSTLKRSVAKVTNFVLDKIKGKDEKLKFDIPFTLKENFSLDIDQTLKKVLSK